jgi:hypothetical protein
MAQVSSGSTVDIYKKLSEFAVYRSLWIKVVGVPKKAWSSLKIPPFQLDTN